MTEIYFTNHLMDVSEISLVLMCATQFFLKHFCVLETACRSARIFWLQGLSLFKLNFISSNKALCKPSNQQESSLEVVS